MKDGRRLEDWASLGLFRPNTVEARNRTTGPPGELLRAFSKAASFIVRGPSAVGNSGRVIDQSAVVRGGAWSPCVTNRSRLESQSPPPRSREVTRL